MIAHDRPILILNVCVYRHDVLQRTAMHATRQRIDAVWQSISLFFLRLGSRCSLDRPAGRKPILPFVQFHYFHFVDSISLRAERNFDSRISPYRERPNEAKRDRIHLFRRRSAEVITEPINFLVRQQLIWPEIYFHSALQRRAESLFAFEAMRTRGSASAVVSH